MLFMIGGHSGKVMHDENRAYSNQQAQPVIIGSAGSRAVRLPGRLTALLHVLAVAASLGIAQSAHAADVGMNVQEEPAQNDARTHDPAQEWAFQATAYMWAAGLDGKISPFRRGPTIAIEKSFSDVLDSLKIGGFINIWGRYDRFVLSGDIMYVDTTDSHNSGPLPSFTIPGVGTIPPGGAIDAKVDSTQFTATLMGGYRVIETPQISLDALAGARFWHISNDVTITGSLGGRTGSVSYAESFGWIDPLIGLRAFIPLTQRLSLQGQADIGGFGAGSDFTWSALATVNYVFSEHLSGSVGYKILDVDYDHDGHVFDASLKGPVLGLTYRF